MLLNFDSTKSGLQLVFRMIISFMQVVLYWVCMNRSILAQEYRIGVEKLKLAHIFSITHSKQYYVITVLPILYLQGSSITSVFRSPVVFWRINGSVSQKRSPGKWKRVRGWDSRLLHWSCGTSGRNCPKETSSLSNQLHTCRLLSVGIQKREGRRNG